MSTHKKPIIRRRPAPVLKAGKPGQGGLKGQGSAAGESISSLKNRAYSIGPGVWVGKSGITQSVIGEIGKQLEKRGLVKVKMLKSALESMDKKGIAKELAEKTGSAIVLQVGHVVTLYKPAKTPK